MPGRAALGAASLLVGVAALAVLVGVRQAFQGQVTGTALGDYISVRVRGVDYLAAAITIGLGAFVGAALGVGATALLRPVGVGVVAEAGVLAAVAGVVAVAVAAPLARISRLAPAHSVQ